MAEGAIRAAQAEGIILRGMKVGGGKKEEKKKNEIGYRGKSFERAHHPFLIHRQALSQP
jgi:hypothetical protein